MNEAHSNSIAGSPKSGRWVFGIGAALVAAVCIIWAVPRTGAEDRGGALGLPADLAVVPENAVAVLRQQVSPEDRVTPENLANTDLAQRNLFADLCGVSLKGLTAAASDQMTMIFLDTAPAVADPAHPAALLVIRTPDNYDRKRVLETIAPGAQEQTRAGKTYYLSGGNTAPVGLRFIDKHHYAFGRAKMVELWIDQQAAGGKGAARAAASKAAWAAALREAARPHAIFLAMQAEPGANEGLAKKLPAGMEALAPLTQFICFSLALDDVEKGKGQIKLNFEFAGEEQARSALPAAKEGIEAARTSMGMMAAMMKADEKNADLSRLLKELDEALGDAKIERKTSAISISAPTALGLMGRMTAGLDQAATMLAKNKAEPFPTTQAAAYGRDQIERLEREAAGGKPDAMLDLAEAYYYGQGVERDMTTARKWYEKAAERGVAKAMRRVGVIYIFGWGVEKDFAVAARWMLKGAEAGDVVAMRNIGVFYMQATGVEKDEAEGLKWTTKAAAAGDREAIGDMGMNYSIGAGVPKDMAKAVEYWTKSAELGEDTAMRNLGIIYAKGTGVEKDMKLATEWYRKAAAAGNEGAKKWLKEREGEGG